MLEAIFTAGFSAIPYVTTDASSRFCEFIYDALYSLNNSFNVFTRRIDPFRADADMDFTLNDPERDLLLRAIAV
jgi:hypothetical protein